MPTPVDGASDAPVSAHPENPEPEPEPEPPSLGDRVRRAIIGAPRSLTDRSLFHRLSLVPFLAWVGLGADGLSSSAYGPEEAFRTLGEHTYIAVALAVLMATTVILIAAAYSKIIDAFPHGGGGYVVASETLGERAGVVSGAALLVDYVLTIAISIAAAGDALFSFVPLEWHGFKLGVEIFLIALLAVLNLRGVRESVLVLTPIFLLFLCTHAALIVGAVAARAGELPATARAVGAGFSQGYATLGVGGLLLLLVHAYSLGGGTYTGIEAVSNGLPIMRAPRAQTAKRTMVYMGGSLAFTATGLLVCYLLWNLTPVAGKTLNAVLIERLAFGHTGGPVFIIAALVSEAALLVVAAQAGFIDGPRVLANMAVDSWMPHRFAALSERLTTQNGILLMAGAALAALVYTHGDVSHLVVMYSINVFLTFSLSMLGMLRRGLRHRKLGENNGHLALFGAGFALCVTILTVTTVEKFSAGGWLTLLVTCGVVVLAFLIRRHYRAVGTMLSKLYEDLRDIPTVPGAHAGPLDPDKPTAVVLVGGYGGLGIHTLLNIIRQFPEHCANIVFVSVGVLDSAEFKGERAVEALRARTRGTVEKYVALARGLGIPATGRIALGTDVVEEAEKLCLDAAREFPKTMYFAGQVVFQRERWYERLLHNETAFAIQKRLQWAGRTMVILPARVT